MHMLFNIKEKRILITGSSGGLGLVFAQGFCEAGAKVIINGTNQDKLQLAVEKMAQYGYVVSAYKFDITNPADVEENIARIEMEHGNIDVLINNAGIQHRTPLEDFSLENWNSVLNTNLSGAFIVSKAVVKGMIERQSGKIINICSLQSELARPTIAPYAAAKGGLKMLTRAMATEWAKHNIQVNAIGPGYFKTEMTKALWENEEFDTWLCKRTPANRWGNPDELVGALIFLSSNASSFVNGQILFVDGGITACI
jgi:gluconate 5-dehydrogenase